MLQNIKITNIPWPNRYQILSFLSVTLPISIWKQTYPHNTTLNIVINVTYYLELHDAISFLSIDVFFYQVKVFDVL